MGNIQTQVNVTVKVESQIQKFPEQRPAPQPQPLPVQEKPLFNEDSYTPTLQQSVEKAVSTPTSMIKKMAGGLIVGGSASTLAGIAGKAMFTESYHAPSLATIASGAALGAGIGLLNIETGDKHINLVKNTVGGSLVGGGATTIAQSVAKSVFTDHLQGPSTSGVLLGTTLGAGIALVNNDTGDKTVDNLKNVLGGTLIGGSAIGLASGLVKTLGADKLASVSPVAIGIGAALGAGIAILNMEE